MQLLHVLCALRNGMSTGVVASTVSYQRLMPVCCWQTLVTQGQSLVAFACCMMLTSIVVNVTSHS